jgi:hypothetical protein
MKKLTRSSVMEFVISVILLRDLKKEQIIFRQHDALIIGVKEHNV